MSLKAKEIRFPFSLLLVCFLHSAVNAQSYGSIKKIDSIRNVMQQLAKENKLHAVAGFYTDDAIVRGNDAMLHGKKEIEAYWQQIRGTGEDWHWEIKCVSGSDALIYQTGISNLTLKYGDLLKTYRVNFCVAWEKQDDGSYKIISDIYH